MNTRYLIILIFFLSLKSLFAQEDYYGKNLNSTVYTASQIIGNSAPQPPDAAAFQKVNFVPVNNYTGRVNISIPIYTITAGTMSVPISLSYNSSGVKVSDMASNVGLNWSLNAGGMISKMTQGMDDFHILHETDANMESAGWLSYTNVTSHGGINPYNDAQPDIFAASAPGLSTKYVFKSPYGTNVNGGVTVSTSLPDAVELEHQGNIIEVTSLQSRANNWGLSGFGNTDITSINGIKYSFGSEEISQTTPCFKSTYVSFQQQFRLTMETVSNYKLDKMFDYSTNKSIDFEYEEYTVNFYDNIKQLGVSYNGGTDIVSHNNGYSYTKYPKLKRLTKITFDKGTVEFIYGLNRLDNTDEKALTEIIIKDNSSNIIKHVKMSYSYFQSSINSTAAQSKRLRLDRIYEVDVNLNELPGHIFDYNTSYEMPPRGSYAHDFLGYNNGSYNASITSPEPKLYIDYKNDVFTKYIRLTPFYDVNDVAVPGNFSLEANVNYAKTYSLSKITYPTGGYNEYEYELNTFLYNNATRLGGGLRIKSQKIVDGKGNEQIVDYEYGTGSIANFPTYALLKGDLPSNGLTFSQMNIGITTFLAPQSQVEFTQGSFVGYKKVTVKDRVNNGFKEFYYISPEDSGYQNIDPTITYDNLHLPSKNWKIIRNPSLYVDKDYLRGKIKREAVYNQQGDIRLEKEFTYTEKEFSTINLKYLNKSLTNLSDQCYDYSSSVYNLGQGNCGGYYEEVNLPIARDLLTTVVTKDYQAGNIVYTQGGTENYPYTFKTTQRYTYDKQFPLLIQESKEVTTCEELYEQGQDCDDIYDLHELGMTKTITYPIKGGNTMQGNIVSSMPMATNLVAKNRLSLPLTITAPDQTTEKHYYKDFGNNIVALEKIDFVSRDNNITNSHQITKRDDKGNILEYKKSNGAYVSRIYSSGENYLLAEIENATYSSIEGLASFGANFTISGTLSSA